MAQRRASLPPFAALRAFEAVGRLGGIRRAAQALGLDHAVVSRHLRGLEERLGVQLVRRSKGSVTLTPEGARFHARVSTAIAELMSATAAAMQAGADRRLRIHCVPGLASQWLMSRLTGFQTTHPDIELELQSSHQSPDFARDEADADIRYVAGSDPAPATGVREGLRRIELARPAVLAVASPTLLASLPPVRAAVDLPKLPLLHEEDEAQWRAWLAAYGVQPTEPLRGPRLWPAQITLEAARRGQGIALANRLLLTEDLAAGRLAIVWPAAGGADEVALGAYVFTARADRWQSPAVARFRRWVRAAMAAPEGPPRAPRTDT